MVKAHGLSFPQDSQWTHNFIMLKRSSNLFEKSIKIRVCRLMQLDATKNKLKQCWIICTPATLKPKRSSNPTCPSSKNLSTNSAHLGLCFSPFYLAYQLALVLCSIVDSIISIIIYDLISFWADSSRKSPLMIAPCETN